MESIVSEVRLRNEYAELYPPLTPGVWEPAAEVGARMLLWQLQQHGTGALGTRLLGEHHFDFRGGWTRGSTELRTRATDPAFNGPA